MASEEYELLEQQDRIRVVLLIMPEKTSTTKMECHTPDICYFEFEIETVIELIIEFEA